MKRKNPKKILKNSPTLRVGDKVKYLSQKGVIVSMKNDKEATIEVEGMRLRVKTSLFFLLYVCFYL